DAALLLDVMAQAAPGDIYGWSQGSSFTAALGLRRSLKIAMWTDTGIDQDVDPQSVLAVQRAAALLADLGHEVREIPLPARWDEPARKAIVDWFAYSVGAAVQAVMVTDTKLLSSYSQQLLAISDALSASDVVTAQAVLARYASTFLAAVDDYDVVLTPTTNGGPVPVGYYDGDEADRMLRWSCHTPWVNLAGVPAVSLPSHVDSDGLPHGVHLVGRNRRDADLLALAAQLENAALWDPVHPPCWDR
ncbi:MAG TPA: amidase family protein, partial [Lentzea sp.]